jgi:hypothetical protein
MPKKNSFISLRPRSLAWNLASGTAVGVAAVTLAMPAQAAFHLWNIRELYTNPSGSLQFIELFTTFGSQQFCGGQSLSVTPAGGGNAHTFTLPSNLPGDTTGHAFLIGTAGIQAAGGPAPDYVLPANFLFLGGGTISFFGANSPLTYAALPTDGVLSRITFGGSGTANNSPQNFPGQIGAVVVPEPAMIGLFALGAGFGLCFVMRRRSS